MSRGATTDILKHCIHHNGEYLSIIAHLLVVHEGASHARSLGDGHKARAPGVRVVHVDIQSPEVPQISGVVGVSDDKLASGYLVRVLGAEPLDTSHQPLDTQKIKTPVLAWVARVTVR